MVQESYNKVVAEFGRSGPVDKGVTAIIHLILSSTNGNLEQQAILGLSHLGLICQAVTEATVTETVGKFRVDKADAFASFKSRVELALAEKDQMERTAALKHVSNLWNSFIDLLIVIQIVEDASDTSNLCGWAQGVIITMCAIFVSLSDKEKGGRGWNKRVREKMFEKRFAEEIAMWSQTMQGRDTMKRQKITYMRQDERIKAERKRTLELYRKVNEQLNFRCPI